MLTFALEAVNNMLIVNGDENINLSNDLSENEYIFSCALYYCGKKSPVGMGATNVLGELFNRSSASVEKAI